MKKFKKLLEFIASIYESDDDSSSSLMLALNEIEKLKRELINKYVAYLNKKEVQKLDKKIKLIEQEVQSKLYQYHDIITHMCKLFFEPFFDIKKIYYENVGVYIFKTCLKAVKVGEINKKKIGVKIRIKNRNETIENEIRKNNLLFERRDTYELRVGDEMIYYFSMK